MNNFFKVLFFVGTNLFFSCNFFGLKMGDFKLLPTPQNFQIYGVSNLQPEDILFFYDTNQKNLPPGSGFLGNIKRVDVKENAQLIFTIDPSIKIKDEGYILKILNEKIIIKAKDKAGLIYGLASLEQLMEDSESNISSAESLPISLEPNLPSSASITIDRSVPQSSSLTITSCATSTNLLVK